MNPNAMVFTPERISTPRPRTSTSSRTSSISQKAKNQTTTPPMRWNNKLTAPVTSNGHGQHIPSNSHRNRQQHNSQNRPYPYNQHNAINQYTANTTNHTNHCNSHSVNPYNGTTLYQPRSASRQNHSGSSMSGHHFRSPLRVNNSKAASASMSPSHYLHTTVPTLAALSTGFTANQFHAGPSPPVSPNVNVKICSPSPTPYYQEEVIKSKIPIPFDIEREVSPMSSASASPPARDGKGFQNNHADLALNMSPSGLAHIFDLCASPTTALNAYNMVVSPSAAFLQSEQNTNTYNVNLQDCWAVPPTINSSVGSWITSTSSVDTTPRAGSGYSWKPSTVHELSSSAPTSSPRPSSKTWKGGVSQSPTTQSNKFIINQAQSLMTGSVATAKGKDSRSMVNVNVLASKFNEGLPTAKVSTMMTPALSLSPPNGSQAIPKKRIKKLLKEEKLERSICNVLHGRNESNFNLDKILSKLLQVINLSVQGQNEMKVLVEKLLRFTLETPMVAPHIARILFHVYDHLPRLILTQQYQQHLWDQNDVDIAKTFRKILVVILEKHFQRVLSDLKDIVTKQKADTSSDDTSSCATNGDPEGHNSQNRNQNHNHNQKQSSEHSQSDENRSNQQNPKGNTNQRQSTPNTASNHTKCDSLKAPEVIDPVTAKLQLERVQKEEKLIAMLLILGNIYNMDLVHIRLIRKGVLDHLLPPSMGGMDHFHLVHIRAICNLFDICGRKLDSMKRKFVSKYLDKMRQSVKELQSDQDQVDALLCLNDIMELRRNNWVPQWQSTANRSKREPLDDIQEDRVMMLTQRDTADFRNLPSIPTNGLSLRKESTESFSSLSSESVPLPLSEEERKCYQYDIASKTFKSLPVDSVKNVESGLDGSCFIVDTRGALSVAGNNLHGELGVESEIIRKVLSHWHDDEVGIQDITSLITKYVDTIDYKRDHVPIDEAIPIESTGRGTVKLMSRGVVSRHRFVLTTANELYGTGCNHYNQLHCESSTTMHSLQQIDPMQHRRRWINIAYFRDNNISLRSIHCGYSSSTFLSTKGRVYVVGYSSFGNLGFGEKHCESHSVLHLYRLRTKIEKIACGFDHTLALDEYRCAYSFGDNEFGQLGHGKFQQNRKQKPKRIDFFATNDVHAVDIACGAFHSAVLDCNGNVFFFGYNREFQCHHSLERDYPLKIAIPHLCNALSVKGKTVSIKCGAFHNVAKVVSQRLDEGQIKESITWYLWGCNKQKQCLLLEEGHEVVAVPTEYNGTGLPDGQRIFNMFPGFETTRILTVPMSSKAGLSSESTSMGCLGRCGMS